MKPEEITELAEAKALIELKEKDLFSVVMKSAHQTIEICKLRTKLLTRCKNCNHKEDQTQVIEFTYDDEIDYIITCDNCGRDTNILLNN